MVTIGQRQRESEVREQGTTVDEPEDSIGNVTVLPSIVSLASWSSYEPSVGSMGLTLTTTSAVSLHPSSCLLTTPRNTLTSSHSLSIPSSGPNLTAEANSLVKHRRFGETLLEESRE